MCIPLVATERALHLFMLCVYTALLCMQGKTLKEATLTSGGTFDIGGWVGGWWALSASNQLLDLGWLMILLAG